MRTNLSSDSKKLLLIMMLLLSGLAASALTSPSTFLPASLTGEGSFFASFTNQVPPAYETVALEATVSTDKADYKPGEIVQISGSGFWPNETVTLQVVHVEGTSLLMTSSTGSLTEYDHAGHEPWQVTAGVDGTLTSSWLVQEDSVNKTLKLTADGLSSGLHAETLFTDALGNDFKQCANDDAGFAFGQCHWINSILQGGNGGNANYTEGMSTLQRFIVQDVPQTGNGVHVWNFSHNATKGGVHAYDFLTSWEQAIQAGADAGKPYVDLTGYTPVTGEPASIDQTLTNARACGPEIPTTGGTPTIEDTCLAVRGMFRLDIPLPDDNFDSKDGDPGEPPAGTSTLAKIRAYESIYGQRYIRIYSDVQLTNGSVSVTHDVAANQDTGDSDAIYVLQWTAPGTQPHDILVEFAAHLAVGGSNNLGFNWGPNLGASSISGGPYHVKKDDVDDTGLGSEDNQIKSDAIEPPAPASVQIVKNTVGGDGTFNFPTSGTLSGQGTPAVPNPIQLTTQNGTASSSVYTFSGLPSTGSSLSISETVPAGWSLTSAICTGDDDATNPANLNIEPGETIVCTFTNIKPDAQIDLSPLTDTNPVNQAHTVTATVQQDDGLVAGAPGGDTATGFGAAPDGTLVTFSLLNNTAGATFVNNVNTCTTTGGTCSVQINTSTAGSVDIHATTTFSVLSVSLTRATGTGGSNSADANKVYVDAQIDLSPLVDTNPVNQAHTITATVQQDDGLPAGAPGGDAATGFGPAPNGTTVTFSLLNNTAGATFVNNVNTCTTTNGTCTVQINTSTAGSVNIHATATFSVGGQSLTRSTGTGGNNSADALKVYVDAQIDLSPLTATNPVHQAHTITAMVQQDDGLPAGAPGGDSATGFGPAPDATLVTFSLLNNTANAAFVNNVNTCTTTNGTCSVQINSSTPGGVDIHATTTFSVGGQSLTRATGTGGLNSADAHKDYVAGTIIIRKVTYPAGGTGFGFTTTGGLSPSTFSLNDGQSRTFPNLAPSPYSVTENDPTASGYELTNIDCSATTGGGTSATPNLATRTVSITLAADGVVDCTFTNSRLPQLKLVKDLVPDPDPGKFDLLDGATVVANEVGDGGNSGFYYTTTGLHNISEAIGSTSTTLLSDYASKVECDSAKGSANPGTSLQISLAYGDVVTCTFTNSRLPTLIVRKVIQGTSETFYFVLEGTPTNPPTTAVNLTPPADGEAKTSAEVIQPGDYRVTETPIPDGWLLTDASCVSDQPAGFVTDNTGIPIGNPWVTFTARYGDDIVCSFYDNEQGGATRTQGFWSTHTVLTNAIWNGTPLPSGTSSITPTQVAGSPDAFLCYPPAAGDIFPFETGTEILAIPLPGQNQVLGGFWANISKKSTGGRRSTLDQARMQFLQQYLAAVLNVHAFGTPIGTTTLANARTAYCSNNANNILAQKNLLAAYNEGGDSVDFTPGANATAQLSRQQANIPFWDTTFR